MYRPTPIPLPPSLMVQPLLLYCMCSKLLTPWKLHCLSLLTHFQALPLSLFLDSYKSPRFFPHLSWILYSPPFPPPPIVTTPSSLLWSPYPWSLSLPSKRQDVPLALLQMSGPRGSSCYKIWKYAPPPSNEGGDISWCRLGEQLKKVHEDWGVNMYSRIAEGEFFFWRGEGYDFRTNST